jgi:hypothetical protein
VFQSKVNHYESLFCLSLPKENYQTNQSVLEQARHNLPLEHMKSRTKSTVDLTMPDMLHHTLTALVFMFKVLR